MENNKEKSREKIAKRYSFKNWDDLVRCHSGRMTEFVDAALEEYASLRVSEAVEVKDKVIKGLKDLIENKHLLIEEHVESLEAKDKEIAELTRKIENYKTVMIAAAEEIMRVWPAHCDSEGYGPANLMHRLENAIPAQYGYSAGAFEKLKAELEQAKKESENEKRLFETLKKVSQVLEMMEPNNAPDLLPEGFSDLQQSVAYALDQYSKSVSSSVSVSTEKEEQQTKKR